MRSIFMKTEILVSVFSVEYFVGFRYINVVFKLKL